MSNGMTKRLFRIGVHVKHKIMSQIDDFMLVLVITAVSVCIGFIVFILNHEKQHKKEMREKGLREAGNQYNSTRQYNKSVHDVTSGPSRTPATPTKGKEDI
jgi:hypothetical protein